MPDILITDIALYVVKVRNRIDAVGVLGAVNAPACQQTGQLRNSDTEKLLVGNMVDPLL